VGFEGRQAGLRFDDLPHFAHDAEAQHAFGEEKLRFQSKPMLINGASAFWSAKQGALHLLKGRTWIAVAVGGAKPADRDIEASRKLAEAMAKKL